MIIPSFAKVNLVLDILKKDPSGCHFIETVFQEVTDFYDEIEFKKSPNLIEIKSNNSEVPLDQRNSIWKAINLVQQKYNIKEGIIVNLKKNIPLKSGLGGASSNAANTLKALNQIWHLNLNISQLETLAVDIGMDTPFFIAGKTALGAHYGEKITLLPDFPSKLKISIITTSIQVQTCDAYAGLDLSQCGQNRDQTQQLIEGLKNGDQGKITHNIHNDFERSIFNQYPKLAVLKKEYLQANKVVALSGSGGCMFEILKN